MKSMTNYDKVREFHKAFGLDLDEGYNQDISFLRRNLISEEVYELDSEIVTSNLKNKLSDNLLKELVDVLYVVYGTAASFGLDIDTAFNRVHESNMSKLDEDGKPIYRDDGKVLKGPNYEPPVLRDLFDN